MFEIFQLDPPLLMSAVVLIVMGCVALVFSLSLARKSRALGRLPKDLSATVFDKTFNVFDVHDGRRRIINSHTGLIIFFAVYGSWFLVTITVVKILEIGAVLGCITLLICASLLMLEESQEVNKTAGTLVKAVEKGTGLGQGDMRTLALLRHVAPKLSRYHLILAVAFFASSIAVPVITNSVVLASAGIASAALSLSSSLTAVPLLSLLLVAALFGISIVAIEISANIVKKRLFGFPPPLRVDVLGRQFYRMKTYVGILHHHPTIREPKPEETDNVNKKEIEEHGKS